LTGIVNITVPSRSGDVISIGGVAEPGETINFIPDATGTPSDITLENTTFGLDSALDTGNPITLNFQGVDITATVSPSLLSFIQVPDSGEGTGLPSGTTPGDGSIIMQAVSPNLNPGDIPNCLDYWIADADSWDDTGDAIWNGKLGNYRLQWNGNGVEPNFNATNQWIEFRFGGMNLQNADGSAASFGNSIEPVRYFITAFERIDSTLRFVEWSGQGQNSAGGLFNNSGNAFSVGVWQGSLINWNGEYSSGLVETSGDSTYPGGTTIPLDVPFIVSRSGNPNNDGTRVINSFGVGEDDREELSGNVVMTAAFSVRPLDADIERLLRFAAFALKDRSITYDLDSDLPGYRDRPLLTSSGVASGITVSVPVVTVTLTNIEPGSEVRVYETGTTTEIDGTEAITGTTFEFSPSVAFDVEIFKRGFKIRKLRDTSVPSSDQSIQVNQLIDRGFIDEA